MKLQPQVRKKSSTNPDTLIHKSLHERPLNTQSVKNSLAPLTQQKIVNQQYQHDRFEAQKLQIQAKYGAITAEGQEQLAFLQAKKAAFWQQHLQNTKFYNQDSSQMTAYGIDVSPKQAIQTKLTIGAPGDKYEQEADRVAASVVKHINAPVSGQSNQNIQREGMPEEDKLMMAPHISNIQREAMPEEEELQTKPQLQLQAGDSSTTATAELESSIQQARGGGQPLADNIRKPMEQAFGADFSGVKVHTDSQADRLNQSIQAKAFTTGQDVFFRQGAYEPESRGGQELIAHELTHVIQQNGGTVRRSHLSPQQSQQNPATKTPKIAEGGGGVTIASTLPGAPILQPQWLINAEKNEFYWEPEEGVEQPGEAPASLAHLHQGELPKEYQVATLARGKRGGGVLLYTVKDYLKRFPHGSGRQATDVYNPFGRFRADLSSFLPAQSLDEKTRMSLLENLAKKDQSYRKMLSKSPKLNPEGYPTEIVADGNITLYYINSNPFGAVYAENPATTSIATHDPSKVAPNPKLTPSLGDFRLAQNSQLTASEVEAWSGRQRSVEQSAVMGASAADAAESAGFDRNEGAGWEWLHLIAHSMGGIESKGPQVADNLVAGTSECNTQMIVVEEFLKDYVLKNKGRAVLMVQASMFDPLRHVGNQISYDFEFYNEQSEPVAVFHFTFNALSRRKPMVMENRSARYGARSAFPEGGSAATTHIPRSQPTAHVPYFELGSSPLDQLVDKVIMEMKDQTVDGFVQWLALQRQAQGGKLDVMVYDEIGDNLTFKNVCAYVSSLHKDIDPAVGQRVLYSFLRGQSSADEARKLWFDFIQPLYGRDSVPNLIKKQVEYILSKK